jgi:hypothetical protein
MTGLAGARVLLVDFQKHLELLEKRITILERQVARLSPQTAAPLPTRKKGDVVQLVCDDPGILYARAYPLEVDAKGRKFCWLGNDGPIQIVLPVAPTGPILCALLTFLHPRGSIRALRLFVNDAELPVSASMTEEGVVIITFTVPESHAAQLDVQLHNIPVVRPSDLGESADNRLLAIGFYGAIVTYQ